MIEAPPGDPSARNGRPLRVRIVGDIDDRGRFPPSSRFGSVALQTRLKSVSSLFSRNPRFGTSSPAPPVCSIVRVYSTTLPHRSATVRFVVSRFSVSRRRSPVAARDGSHTPSYDSTSPGS